ncbi:MAG: hypothetical protein D6795_08405 [Deltaproteobacteria bacterium]|nr:MAG: hypothetical protein D6795_08405 [Deltaproteobacteria bacterium]
MTTRGKPMILHEDFVERSFLQIHDRGGFPPFPSRPLAGRGAGKSGKCGEDFTTVGGACCETQREGRFDM